MNTEEANSLVSALIEEAMAMGPKDPLTTLAHVLLTGLRLALFPTVILIPPFTFILGLVATITFGVLLLALSVIWVPFLGFLLGSSWVWLNVPVSRPFLLLPGVLVAVLADIYNSLVPDMGEKYQKVLKMGLCDSWPYSFLVFQLSRGVEE